jgi:hypothetical protein
MAVLYDARGNEIRVGPPDTVTSETVTDSRPITAGLSALNAEVVMDLNGADTAMFDVRTGAASLTLVFEGTVDGVNYIGLPAFTLATAAVAPQGPEAFLSAAVITTTHAALYTVDVAGFRRVRIRVSAFTSGAVTVAARASVAALINYLKPIPAILWVTVTAAANAAATITLPAGGAGLFHYIVYLNCRRNSTAALAGTATLIITTTNLPGSPAWSSGNAMIAGDTKEDVNYQAGIPLKSLVANTATTIVMPAAGAAVLNRGNCGYYVGA